MKNIIVIIFIIIITVIFLPAVHAQETTLSLSPPLVEAAIKPGKSILIAYTLKNLGDPNIFKIRVLPFVPSGNRGNITIKKDFEGPIRFTLDNSDIALEKPFFIKTRGTEQILLSIRVPDGAPEGDYYYTLLAETQPPPSAEGFSASRAKVTIGSNIVLTVTRSGQVDVKGRILLFDLITRYKFKLFNKIWRIVDSGDKIPVDLIIENFGNNVIKPQGNIALAGNFGERASYEILSDNVLAASQRELKASPSALLAESSHSLILSGFFLGRYKLSTSISFGEGSSIFSVSTSFLALPLKFLIGLIISIICALIIFKKMMPYSKQWRA